MTAAFDMVVRGGLVVDGSGGEPFVADVAVKDGLIAAIGVISGTGKEEINAAGLLVTPGFVDVHTHYDGQVTWEDRLTPSSQHGVTTVVMGNCGIGFAPCRPHDRDRLIHLMEGVEDLPEPVLAAGIPWAWESFPEYLNFLGKRQYDIDIAAMVPHAPLRVFVMGERASNYEEATAEDRAAMAELMREALEAGAIGFATSRTITHVSSDGSPMPTDSATEEELSAIAQVLADTGRGVLQLISDLDGHGVTDPAYEGGNMDAELGMMRRLAKQFGRPLSLSLMQWHNAPEKHRKVVRWLEECSEAGLAVKAQVSGRPIGTLYGFEMSWHPFWLTSTFMRLSDLSPAERYRALSDPAIRSAIIIEESVFSDHPAAKDVVDFKRIFALGRQPNYEPDPNDNLADLARRQGTTPEALAYDFMMEEGGQGALFRPYSNYAYGNLEPVREMLVHPDVIYGLGDGGAHLGYLCDANLPTFMLQYWVRDRTKGPRLPLAEVVCELTSRTAMAVGLADRGRLAVGLRADLNIIDFERLQLQTPRIVYDLPAGGRRLTQGADGYIATIVAGVPIRRDGQDTGARPGRLIRAYEDRVG